MFADLLDSAQKHTLVQVLCEVAAADGQILEVERELIHRYALSLGLSAEALEGTLVQPQRPDTLEDYPDAAKRIIYLEAATLAMLDAELADKEVQTLERLADRLGLSRTMAQRLEQHVQQGFDWNAAGLRLVEEGC
ncbi:putative tellurite resistance protein B-like protein [Deinococcus sp. HSC-46F16]|uniref:TerB family tellurite resistance protein n=1 Tax=Deinococcus sp. HSC-46F16 TaxID=2910968 RepID=UPI00209D7800|nr:TerB family tellurite resistance protein [Deinococcus sp. HSC-46F16]MCP2015923.1 putative tellurite resistance protein B-like protein [Deinococcus sp. HSC-46F16]